MTPIQPRLYACAICNTDTWSVPDAPEGDPKCARCSRPMKVMYGTPAVLPPSADPMDETLTAFLSGPLPEEALKNSENPANLFGKYVFLREIGRGATGRVVKAWDTYLSRYVALKFLHSSAPQNVELDASERVQDFLREARIAARLQHPNIVRIHEVDCRENRYFISMDFIGGGTLSDLIHGSNETRKQTRFYLETDRLLRLMRAISIAVHHAHTQIPPVVHRDLKPQNVLIDAKGVPYVADFGLANEVQLERGDGRRGDVRGTPAYMAPEQALGEIHDIDPRTDVYSLGTILYEMLTGDAPFRGSNIPSVLRKIVSESPEPPSQFLGQLVKKPQGLDTCPAEMKAALELLCLQSLSKKREDRPQTALDFADALEPWIEAPRDPSARTTEIRGYFKKRRLRLVMMATLPLLVLVLLLSWRFRAPSPASAQPTALGDQIAGVATGFLSSGKWTSFGEAVIELRRRAPSHPSLPEFEAALQRRGADVQNHRNEWATLLNGLGAGPLPCPSEEFRRRLEEIPEMEDELRGALDLSVTRIESSILEHAREIAGESRDAWATKETKLRAVAVRDRATEIDRFARDLELAADLHPLAEARTLLDPVIEWRGTWNLRINVRPYAEFRVLQDGKERARDFTPSGLSRLEIGASAAELELFWPSEKNPQRRWKSSLGNLKPGETVVISGSMDSSDLEVERK